MNWWQRLRKRDRLERELDAELRFHFEAQVEDNRLKGMSEPEARRQARLAFGGLDQLKEDCRDVRGTRWVDDIAQDLRFAGRLIAKDRWFTLAAVVALALGIGANTTVFTLVNAVMIRGLPFDNPDRIVSVGTRDSRSPSVPGPPGYRGMSYLDYQDWRAATAAFAGIGAYNETTMNVSEEGRAPERFTGAYVSSNAFRLIGQQPALGRDFRPADDRPGAPAVVVMGHGLWMTRYAGDPTTIGRTVRINGVPSTVIGVMPVGFRFPQNADMWQPLAQMPDLMNQRRDARVLDGFGRLGDGVSLTEAQANLNTIAARLSRVYPETNTDVQVRVAPYDERYIAPQVKLIVLALMGAVAFVLLIACANVANLLLARSAARAREIAIRVSLGATRWRIVRQLLVESVLLATLAGLVGFGLSVFGVRLFSIAVNQTDPPPYWLDFTMDGQVFGFLAAACLGTAILFGLAPALHISKTNVDDVLKEGGRAGSDGRRVRRWTSALVIAELALTLVLLAGAGSMMRRFLALYHLDLGIETAHLTTMRLDLPPRKYTTPEQRTAFYERLEERLAAIGAIRSAAIASSILTGGPPRQLAIDGRPLPAGEKPPVVSVTIIGTRYFETLGAPLIRGRAFTSIDGTPGRESAIVNQRFAQMYFPNEDPLGRRIRLTTAIPRGEPRRSVEREGGMPWMTIVGTSPTVVRPTTRADPAVAYLPYRAEPGAFTLLLVRDEAEPGAIAAVLREEVRALDPDLPLWNIRTLDEWLAFSRWPERVFGTMFAIFAGIALVLSAVGLYAITAYAVTQRTQEIGVRMALGAQAYQVRWLILGRVMAQLCIGLVLGLPGAFGVGRLPWMDPRDPLTLVTVVLALVVVTVAACLLPARRATRLDPVAALRCE